MTIQGVERYTNIRVAGIERPVHSLQGFAHVTLKPGESRKIEFPLGFEELSFYNAKSQRVIEPAEYTVFIGGSSLADQAAHFVTLP
ncbi:fibronectin type III-like domain-contianing protein [Terriglobus sp. 2YAB30_2]|uniref:fibronectin type III-like domain-contianing protein n=1 Tax=unclassified Terriglobus TaxID=2628988 RepID=UPI003F9E4343